MQRETQYYIAQGENVQGPFGLSRLQEWIELGKVRPDMLFSREGGDWVPGHDCPELFPHLAVPAPVAPALPRREPQVAAPVAAAPVVRGAGPRRGGARRRGGRDPYDDGYGRPRRAARRPSPPGSVVAVAILDFIGALFYGVGGLLVLVAAARVSSHDTDVGGAVGAIGVVLILFAVGYLTLGVFLAKGSAVARILQICLSGLGLLHGVYGASQGGAVGLTLVGLALNVLIIVMLLTPAASAYFAGVDPARSVRGRGGGSRRRRRY